MQFNNGVLLEKESKGKFWGAGHGPYLDLHGEHAKIWPKNDGAMPVRFMVFTLFVSLEVKKNLQVSQSLKVVGRSSLSQ